MYYLTIRTFVCGSGEYGRPETDDNNGYGYSLKEARKKQAELHTLKNIGRCLDGIEVTIYSFEGELVS